jgi:pentatricopeptide repeat protein
MNNKSQSPPPSSAEKEEGHKKRLLQQEDSIVNKATPNDAAQNGNVESAPTIRSTAMAKKQNSKRMDPDALKLRITIQQCCSNDDLMTAIQAYDVAVAKGSTILAQCFYNLLALCDGLAERDAIHIGTPKTTLLATNTTTPTPTPDPSITCGDGASINNNGYQATDTMAAATSTTTDKTISQNVKVSCVMSIAERRRHASRIKAHMDALQIPATEPVYTSLVKLICKTKELDEAETLLQQAQHVQQCRPKLRMYAPLLTAYCQRGQLNKAVHVWLLLSQQDLQVTEREYASLISCATQCGNRVVMERVLCDLAEDVLVPSRGTCQAVAEWFQSPAAVTTKSVQDNSSNIDSSHQTDDDSAIAVQDLLKQIRIPQQSFPSPNMGPVHAPIGWAISNACSIDTRTGTLQSGCLKGQRLLPIEISPELWQEMKNANETIVLQGGLQQHASVPFQGGRKGKKLRTDDMSERPRHWQQFQDFVLAFTKRNNNKIDIVIDGANVGYYRRSFPDAPKHVDYAQIDWIVEHFQKQQKSVLLIMHSRHFSRSLMPREFEVRRRLFVVVLCWRKTGCKRRAHCLLLLFADIWFKTLHADFRLYIPSPFYSHCFKNG